MALNRVAYPFAILFFAKGGTFFASSRLRGNSSTRPRSRSIRNFDHSCKILNKLIRACYPVPVFAEMDPRQFFPSSNLSAVPLPHYPPKSLPLNLFTDPHSLNPVVSILYKNMGGEGVLRSPLVVPRYRYVDPTYLLCLPFLRKHRGCGAILPILERAHPACPDPAGGPSWSLPRCVIHFLASLSPLTATLIDPPASVANKRVAARLNPLDATGSKNPGRK